MTHVFDIRALCGEAFTVGSTPKGLRVVIPITGGDVSGERLTAAVVPGGADYQLVDTVTGRVEYEAIYNLLTPDGHHIHVRNRGVSTPAFSPSSDPSESSDEIASPAGYFVTTPVFEAPASSPYSWLNNRIFICKPVGFADGAVTLRIWLVD